MTDYKEEFKAYVRDVKCNRYVEFITKFQKLKKLKYLPELSMISRIVDIRQVLKYPDLPWNYDSLFYNDNISYQDIRDHPELPWEDWHRKEVQENEEREPLDPNYRGGLNQLFVSDGAYLTREEFLKNPLVCDGVGAMCNPNILWEDFQANPRFRDNRTWLAYNKNVTLDIIKNNPEPKWCFDYVSKNPNLTVDFILERHYEKWNWMAISDNDSMLWADILRYHKLPWKVEKICENLFTEQFKLIEEECACEWNKTHPVDEQVTVDVLEEGKETWWDMREKYMITRPKPIPDLDLTRIDLAAH